MTPDRSRHIGDLILAALVIVGAGILIVGAADLPPPRFEPLGSAAMPRILAAVLILLAALVAFAALRGLWAGSDPSTTTSFDVPFRGIVVFVALVAYVAALDFGRIPFVPATAVFVTIAGVAMAGISLRSTLIYGALGLVLALVLSWVFETFLYIRIG